MPAHLRERFLSLWEEYEQGISEEARLVKALDKLETIIQHNQGADLGAIDYAFNIDYGWRYMDVHPVIRRLRSLVDADTRAHAERQQRENS